MDLVSTEAAIGGEVEGLDLNDEPGEGVREAIRGFLWERGVIVVHDQRITPEAFLSFARIFGEPDEHFLTHYAHPTHSNILVISNIIEDGRSVGFADAGRVWHSDGSYLACPVAVTLLYALEVPRDGERTLGDTEVASSAAAYEGLPAELKGRIAGLEAVHQVAGRRRSLKTGLPSDREEDERQPDVVHPLVRRHPETGRRYLFATQGECIAVPGMEEGEALTLIDALASEIQRPRYRHTHRWSEGDLLIWDNRAVQHLATFDYEWPRHRRLMHRITIPETA